MIGFVALVAAMFASPDAREVELMTHRSSLVVVKFRSAYGLKSDCPPDLICMRHPYSAQFDTVRTVAGDRIEKKFAARIWLHNFLRRDRRYALILAHKPSRPDAVLWTSVDNHGMACFDRGYLNATGLDVRVVASDEDDRACVDTNISR